jgi:hypothetical protein
MQPPHPVTRLPTYPPTLAHSTQHLGKGLDCDPPSLCLLEGGREGASTWMRWMRCSRSPVQSNSTQDSTIPTQLTTSPTRNTTDTPLASDCESALAAGATPSSTLWGPWFRLTASHTLAKLHASAPTGAWTWTCSQQPPRNGREKRCFISGKPHRGEWW